MIRLIIFDWDDVITIGSKEGYFKCYHQTLLELGVHLDPVIEHQRILAKWSQPHYEELRELLKEKPELLDKAGEIYENKLLGDTFVSALGMIGGTIELLNKLHQKYLLAVATGMQTKLLKEIVMPKFKVPPVFSQIISTYDIGDVNKYKPHPYVLHKIMRTQKVKPKNTLFVGDAKTDVLMARAAQIVPVVVLTGHLTKKEAEELKVSYIIKDITYLPQILKQLM